MWRFVTVVAVECLKTLHGFPQTTRSPGRKTPTIKTTGSASPQAPVSIATAEAAEVICTHQNAAAAAVSSLLSSGVPYLANHSTVTFMCHYKAAVFGFPI